MKRIFLLFFIFSFFLKGICQSYDPPEISISGGSSQLFSHCPFSFECKNLKQIVPSPETYFEDDGSLKSNYIISVFWKTNAQRLIPYDPGDLNDRDIPDEFSVTSQPSGTVINYQGFWTDVNFQGQNTINDGTAILDKILLNVNGSNYTQYYINIPFIKIERTGSNPSVLRLFLSDSNYYIEETFNVGKPVEPELVEIGDPTSFQKKISVVMNDYQFETSDVPYLNPVITTVPITGGFEDSFSLNECETFTYTVNSKFNCPAFSHSVPLKSTLSIRSDRTFDFQVFKSDIPFDKAYVIKVEGSDAKFLWQKLKNNVWETIHYGYRLQFGDAEPVRVIGSNLTARGCTTKVSPTIYPTTADIGKQNSISIKILKNGIPHSDVLDPSRIGIDFIENITFEDAIGRPIQSKEIAAGKNGEDIIKHFVYENVWGRQLNDYLPYASANQQGRGVLDQNAAANQSSFYQTHPEVAHDNKPFSNVVFDDSKDISKVIKSYGPGAAWKNTTTGIDKFSKQESYLYKHSEFSSKPIYRFLWGYPLGWNEKAMTDNDNPNHQTYWDQELMVSESISEDGQKTFSFTNQLGQTVATRIMPLRPASSLVPLTTYYVYDPFGRLRMKIPPNVSKLFGTHASIVHSGGIIQLAPDLPCGPLVNALCTRYFYDDKGRLIEEHKPGGGKVETVYDILNRPVMSQDESQRLGEGNRWSFVKYDRIGRQVLTGEIFFGTTTKTRQQLQAEADLATIWFEKPDNAMADFQGYTNQAFPVLAANSYTLLTVDYYDGYDFKRGNDYTVAAFDPTSATDFDWNTSVLGDKPNLCADLQSLQTGHKVRVLGSEAPGEWLLDLMVYDEKERLIATGSDNRFGVDGKGDEDWVYTQYENVYGKVVRTFSTHKNQNFNQFFPGTTATIKNYNYTDKHQINSISMIINGGEETQLVAYDYDIFGKVKTKHLCDNLQHVDYTYDIRGRLTHINNPDIIGPDPGSIVSLAPDADIFGMRLVREDIANSGSAFASTTPARFDGTITGQQWKSLSDKTGRAFSYKYDDFNRIETAEYFAKANTLGSSWGGTESNLYKFEKAEYDENGNLLKLQQNGPVSKTAPKSKAVIDDLGYEYEQLNGHGTNKLIMVTEEATSSAYQPVTEKGFRRDFAANAGYTYGDAGRLLTDNGKGITNITYNLLDLPETIEFQSGSTITTKYAADGRKLEYVYTAPSLMANEQEEKVSTYYASSFQYRLGDETNIQIVPPRTFFMNTEVGKAVYMLGDDGSGNAQEWQHQYHIYDHQGNLRIAFQQSYTKGEYEAGMEQINAAKEEQEFEFVAETRELNATESRTGSYLSNLNPLNGKPLGPMKWVKVDKGDTVAMEAFAHYNETTIPNGNATWQQGLAGFLLGSLANSIYSATLENGQPNPAYQQLVLLGTTLAAMGINQTQTDLTIPRAYLKWIKYDTDSVFESQGIMPITDEANDSYQRLFLQMVAAEDGFVQFFVANESLREVFFDDITGLVRRPKIIQEGHYNPFGLPLAGLTTLGNPEYAYFFTGKELYEDEALQWYDYGARMYDVQIGRWTTHDPVYQDDSPYIFCGNNGVNYVDLDGRKWNWWDIPLTIGTGGLWGVGKFAYENGVFKGSKLDKWLAKNEKIIVNVSFMAVGIGLSFIPGVNILGAIAISAALAGTQSVYNTHGMSNKTRWEQFGLSVGLAIVGSAAGYGSSMMFKNAFLGTGHHLGMALQGAASGMVTGAFMGLASGVVSNLAQGNDPFDNIGKSMLVGMGVGGAMGAGMGFAMSYRHGAGREWQSRRLIYRANKSVNSILASENANTAKEAIAGKQDIESLISSDSDVQKLHDFYDEGHKNNFADFTKNDVETLGPDDLFYVEKQQAYKDRFNIRFRPTTSKYTRGTYLKGIVHEYGHVHYKTFIFNDPYKLNRRTIQRFGTDSETWEHLWMKSNFRNLRH